MGFKLVTTAQDELEPIIVSRKGHKRRDPVLERVAEYFARYAWEEPKDPSPTKGRNIKVSAKKVAQKAGLSQDTVNDRVEILIEMGVLTVTGRTEAGARIMDMDLEAGYRYNGFPFHPTYDKKSNREAPTDDADPTDSIGSPYPPGREAPYPPGRHPLPTVSGEIKGLKEVSLKDASLDAASSIYSRYSSSSSTTDRENDDERSRDDEEENLNTFTDGSSAEDEKLTGSDTQTPSPPVTASSPAVAEGTSAAAPQNLEGIRNPDKTAGWEPSPSYVQEAKRAAPDVRPDLLVSEYVHWCYIKGMQKSDDHWMKWVYRKQRELDEKKMLHMLEKDREQRVEKPWYEKELRF